MQYSKENENFHLKMFDIFLIFAQNIDCGYMLEPPRRGGSNEYPQHMFWSKNKKNRYTPANLFYYIKVGFRGYSLHEHVFLVRLRQNGCFIENFPLSYNFHVTIKANIQMLMAYYIFI